MSELQRHASSTYPAFAVRLLSKLLYPAIFGAYTELFAGLSPELTLPADQGGYVIPWGRKARVRPDVEIEGQKEEGMASQLYEWCDRVTRPYA